MFEAVSKQDKQAARTAADLERRYGAKFSEVMGIAEEAREAAEEAKVVVEGLDQDAIFNLLTRNGEVQGMFMDEKGQIYINASYLAAGIIASAGGTVKIDLGENKLEITIPPEESYYALKSMVFDKFGLQGYSENEVESMMRTMAMIPGYGTLASVGDNTSSYWTRLLSYDCDLWLDAINLRWPEKKRKVRIGPNADVVILGKKVSWKPNSDGTYTLIGTDE